MLHFYKVLVVSHKKMGFNMCKSIHMRPISMSGDVHVPVIKCETEVLQGHVEIVIIM